MAAETRELAADGAEAWPALPLAAWQDTCTTLHMWTQVVGKIRLALAPYRNHWWQTALYLTARGLTTSPMPYHGQAIQIDFDFIDHQLLLHTSAGGSARIELQPRSVADFYELTLAAVRDLGVRVHIWPMPMEVEAPIRFTDDRVHASYDRDYAHRFWRVLLSVHAVLDEFRGRFIGKCSPVHFFWGGPDLAVTRFSGRRRPDPPPGPIDREGYSHEVSSVGFWPGGRGVDASFYAYAAPAPDGFAAAAVRPAAAYYHRELGEFLLPYEAVRTSHDARATLLDFCQSTYEAAATLAGWDRAALEHP